MKLRLTWLGSTVAAVVAVAAALCAYWWLPLAVWTPAFPALLVSLSMLGAAVLVRLARNAPITTPAAFDEADLRRFFDTLEELSRRLFWIFLQVIVSLFVVILSIVVADGKHGVSSTWQVLLTPWCSGALALLFVWLLWRVVQMARGDIGFLKLQREILEGSLARQRKKEAEKVVAAPVEFRSPGGYGRALP
jgi:ABC-type uncharacterized transport system fused permease/ATPase subunit